jgi:hypothetical protein
MSENTDRTMQPYIPVDNTVLCWVSLIPTMMPNVRHWRYLTTLRYGYDICHFWTPICNVLGHWRHRSICYTSLFTTPLVVTTISVYSVLWPFDVVSRSGPLISSLLSVRWSLFGVFISVSLLSVSSLCIFYLSSFSDSVSSQSHSLRIEPHLGPITRYLFLPNSYVLVSVGRPL